MLVQPEYSLRTVSGKKPFDVSSFCKLLLSNNVTTLILAGWALFKIWGSQ
jgi:hypothetical protein